jgi:hypothetical protein
VSRLPTVAPSNLCTVLLVSVSDTVPEDPVFAVKTGLVYSRRLIEKAIAADGKCPVSDADLSTDDLVPVKGKLQFCVEVITIAPRQHRENLKLFLAQLSQA